VALLSLDPQPGTATQLGPRIQLYRAILAKFGPMAPPPLSPARQPTPEGRFVGTRRIDERRFWTLPETGGSIQSRHSPVPNIGRPCARSRRVASATGSIHEGDLRPHQKTSGTAASWPILSCFVVQRANRMLTAMADKTPAIRNTGHFNHPHCAKFCVLGGATCGGIDYSTEIWVGSQYPPAGRGKTRGTPISTTNHPPIYRPRALLFPRCLTQIGRQLYLR
jgi:hypothetical protein